MISTECLKALLFIVFPDHINDGRLTQFSVSCIVIRLIAYAHAYYLCFAYCHVKTSAKYVFMNARLPDDVSGGGDSDSGDVDVDSEVCL